MKFAKHCAGYLNSSWQSRSIGRFNTTRLLFICIEPVSLARAMTCPWSTGKWPGSAFVFGFFWNWRHLSASSNQINRTPSLELCLALLMKLPIYMAVSDWPLCQTGQCRLFPLINWLRLIYIEINWMEVKLKQLPEGHFELNSKFKCCNNPSPDKSSRLEIDGR